MLTMLRVLIDGYFLGKPYGFGRFISELCRAIGTVASDIKFIVAVPGRVNTAQLPQYPAISWHSVPDANFIKWEQIVLPRLAQTLSCNLIHFPYNTKALKTGTVRTVVTVHDTLFLRERAPLSRPKDFLASQYSRFVFRAGTQKVNGPRHDAVVAVSNTTRLALAERGIVAKTVYNTADGFVSSCMPPNRPKPQTPYFFHRGGYAEHRNTGRVIAAFQSVRPLIGDITLKIVGAPEGAEKWRTQDDPSIQFLPRVSDEEMGALYAGGLGVIVTSLFEGFGLPIIEGFGFGTPVITSAIDPMKEVAGDAALLVDPFAIAEIAAAMKTIALNDNTRTSLINRGGIRKKLFSSSRVAEQMIEVYHNALD